MIRSPFTEEQVSNLNSFQRAQPFHPFICGNNSTHKVLTATINGWICENCEYTQDWAHSLMANKNWENWLDRRFC